MLTKKHKHCAQCFRVLADKTRIQLLKLLKDDGSHVNVNNLSKNLRVSQPTVSYHLAALKDIGLVLKERQGRETFYTFNKNYPCKGCGVFNIPIKL